MPNHTTTRTVIRRELVNPNTEVIGQHITLDQQHATAVLETESYGLKQKCRNDYCNRIIMMISWIKEKYPEYYNVGIVDLGEEEMADKIRYGQFTTQTQDFVYSGLNVSIIKAFMAAKRFKSNGNEFSYDHMRKYKNAIEYGAKRAKQALPQDFDVQMTPFMVSLKKQKTVAKKSGNLDECEADPITFSLYRLISFYAISTGNIFVWAFTVCQWNCMARSINIDGMSYSQISLGIDSIIIEYFDSKSDQTGEKTVPKNCYPNPYDPCVCLFTALGCFLATKNDAMDSGQRTIFQSQDVKEGTAAHIYNTQLKALLEGPMKTILPEYIRPNHANSHGTRKGAGTYATSGTTCPPPIPSVAGRGEWSMGKVFDVYWTFAHAGDQYLGRILAGLDPNTPQFAAIPPHFIEGIENEYINEAMNLCFGFIMDRNQDRLPNIIGILMRLLASMVHHSDFILSKISNDSLNPLAKIPIYADAHLLRNLKKLVQTKATTKIPKATGIPPHTSMICSLNDLINKFIAEKEERLAMFERLGQIVSDKLEQIAADNGSLTRSSVEGILQSEFSTFKQCMQEEIRETVKYTLTHSGVLPFRRENEGDHQLDCANTQRRSTFKMYAYSGRMFFVPENFNFPCDVQRKAGWIFWLKGMDFQGKFPVRPFRFLTSSMLPKTKDVKKQYNNEWKPIMTKMEKTPGLVIPNDLNAITSTFIDESYKLATEHLKANVCNFIWSRHLNHENWTVGTWSMKTSPNQIRKFGTNSDVANLPAPTHHNRPHSQKRTLVRKDTERISRKKQRLAPNADIGAAMEVQLV